MTVAEPWESPEQLRSKLGTATVHITIVDRGPDDEQRLLLAAQAVGVNCRWAHLPEALSDTAVQQADAGALLFEAGPELEPVQRCLRALRADPYFDGTPAILAVSAEQLADWDLALGFDDFVLSPCTPLEVRARSRAVEQRRREANPEAVAAPDGIVIDQVAQEAHVHGRTVRLTARELALLEYLRARRGRVLSRQHLLTSVWGHRYRGGPRTVDTHIGRLRLKFGSALPIETLRTNGYRLGKEPLSAGAAPAPAELLAHDGVHDAANLSLADAAE
jgi:two-component system phosphate regulon response regulator PhoB